jgi:hypothetical protein
MIEIGIGIFLNCGGSSYDFADELNMVLRREVEPRMT